MVEKYRYYGMVWNFPTIIKFKDHRFRFGGITNPLTAKKNREEVYKYSGKAVVLRVFNKKNRKGKNFKLYVQYFRDTGKRPKPKPFDWSDPENKRRYNLK